MAAHVVGGCITHQPRRDFLTSVDLDVLDVRYRRSVRMRLCRPWSTSVSPSANSTARFTLPIAASDPSCLSYYEFATHRRGMTCCSVCQIPLRDCRTAVDRKSRCPISSPAAGPKRTMLRPSFQTTRVGCGSWISRGPSTMWPPSFSWSKNGKSYQSDLYPVMLPRGIARGRAGPVPLTGASFGRKMTSNLRSCST
jgi:hypothetical protein